MAIPTQDGKYACMYCEKVYPDPTAADTCRDNHKLVYVPFTREDLNSLLAFLYTKNERDLTETVVKVLLRYRTVRQELKKSNKK